MTIPAPRQESEVFLSAPTRYLCAAAHLNPRFAEDVLKRTLYESHRAVAGSPGTDLVPVVEHCLAARRRRLQRDAALALIGVAGLAALVNLRMTLAGALLLLAWFVVLTESAVARFEAVGRLLGLVPGVHPVATKDRDRQRLDELRRQQRGNVSVYSGFSPFVGSGVEIGAWSFALNVCKGRERLDGEREQPQEVVVSDLYEAVTERLIGLGVEGLTLEDRLHVHGQDVRKVATLLPDPFLPPTAAASYDVIEHFRRAGSGTARHYLAIRVEDWRGELVLSVFLRFRRVAENLFVESSQFLLTPVAEKLHEIDRFTLLPTSREIATLLTKSVVLTPVRLVLSYASLWRLATGPLNRALRDRSDRVRIVRDASYDYGALPTVRERYSSPNYRRYFQKLDKEMYTKLLDRTVLEVLTEFLDSRGVDTSALDERRSMILNSGVMVTGGSFTAGTVAAGTGARANTRGGALPSVPIPSRRS